jgi:DNA-directed RNA polymerase subunit RPC12/RpoP
MTYSTQEERETATKQAKKISNQKFYDDLKKNPELYKERLTKAGKQAVDRHNTLEKSICIYCGHMVLIMKKHELTKIHKDSVEIMNEIFLEL